MNDKIFFDSNILVYAHTDVDGRKQLVAQKLIADNFSFISTQVLQEIANTLNKKFKHPWIDVEKTLTDSIRNNNLYTNNQQTVIEACRLAQRYQFSFYDSLIISAALQSDCSILYSEDLNNGQVIEGKLKIINPFI